MPLLAFYVLQVQQIVNLQCVGLDQVLNPPRLPTTTGHLYYISLCGAVPFCLHSYFIWDWYYLVIHFILSSHLLKAPRRSSLAWAPACLLESCKHSEHWWPQYWYSFQVTTILINLRLFIKPSTYFLVEYLLPTPPVRLVKCILRGNM